MPERSHKMSVRFGLTAVDQCVSSLSNFAVGVAVARVAGVAAFGAYALVYSVWLVLAAMHRSLITDPMAIENDLRKADAPQHVEIGLAAELCLGLAAVVLFAAAGVLLLALGQHEFGLCFLGITPWLPFLLAQDYWRWVGFMKSQPQKALTNDIVFDVIQLATFAALLFIGIRSSLLAVTAWGVGAAGGALFGLWQFSARPAVRHGIGRIKLRWGLSKWIVGGNVTASATAQSTVVLTGALLGPVSVGGLKAATSLVSGPSLVLIQAGGSIGLPEASRALKERGWPGLRRVQRFITAAGVTSVGLIAIVVFLFGRQLLVVVYGRTFGRYASIADILAFSYFVSTFSLGAILCLKATRKTSLLFPVAAISLVVSIVAVAILDPLFGITGAAVATVIGNGAMTLGLLVAHLRSSKKAAEAMSPATTPVAGPMALPTSTDLPTSTPLPTSIPSLALALAPAPALAPALAPAQDSTCSLVDAAPGRRPTVPVGPDDRVPVWPVPEVSVE